MTRRSNTITRNDNYALFICDICKLIIAKNVPRRVLNDTLCRSGAVKNSRRESSTALLVFTRRSAPRRAASHRTLSRHSSRLLLRHAWKSWFHSCRIDFAAYMARESARIRVCVRARPLRRERLNSTARDTAGLQERVDLHLPRLPNAIDVYRRALARKKIRGRTHARPRVRKSYGDSEPSGIHGVWCQ